MRSPQAIVALDVPDRTEALSLVEQLGDAVDFFKVGLQLFVREGPGLVRELRRRGCRIFLDLKLHDIPNTVAGAVRSASHLDVELLTVHLSGGRAMVSAAVEEAAPGMRILGVSVLTSMDGPALGEAWGCEPEVDVRAQVLRLAGLAAECGVPGLVCSVGEASAVRGLLPGLALLTPGIRLSGQKAGDQARVSTPSAAVRAGADYLVLGRAVTAASSPRDALTRALEEMKMASGTSS